jgi:hypothetical protein
MGSGGTAVTGVLIRRSAVQCGCIKLVNRELAKHNTEVETITTFTVNGKLRERLCVPTTKMDKKKRGPALKVFATYCPMCGVEIPKDE